LEFVVAAEDDENERIEENPTESSHDFFCE